MTTHSEQIPVEDKPKSPVLYRKGEFAVTVVRLKDEQLADFGTRNAFALVHVPTNVIVSTGGLLGGMIQAAYALDEGLKEVKANPAKLHEEIKAAGGDFDGGSVSPPKGFQF